MSYTKAMKHWRHHRKDRYYQQCGFTMHDENIESLASIAERTAESYHVRDIRSNERLTDDFSTDDEAVDFIRQQENQLWLGVYTDKGFSIMRG